MKILWIIMVGILSITNAFGEEQRCHGKVPPPCTVLKRSTTTTGDWEPVSYCGGDFPYCATFDGDCCSDPPDNSGIGGACCNTGETVAHEVEELPVHKFAVENYKCCSIASYGNNSTYYFDAGGHAQCCGGRVYEEKAGSAKTCCNNEYNTDGSVKRYHSVANVMGAPAGSTEKICCVTKGDAPAGYKQTAYWNGGPACCDGKTYKKGADDSGTATYGCCEGTKGNNKTHKVVDALGAPNGEQACCKRGEDGSVTAYWNGSSASCCLGKVQKTGSKSYGCCSGDTIKNPTHKKVSVLDAPNGEETCCDISIYGENPTAYWKNGSAICCKGQAAKKDDGTYVCCPNEVCKEGQYSKVNLVDGIGACGTICCSKPADYSETDSDGMVYAYSGYTLADYAQNGRCCGGYTSTKDTFNGYLDHESSSTFAVRNNNGYYCATSGWSKGYSYGLGSEVFYPSDSKVCFKDLVQWKEDGDFEEDMCWCWTSSSGNPLENGECGEDDDCSCPKKEN